MTEDFCRDTADSGVRVAQPLESGLNGNRILMKPTEWLFFTVEEIGAAGTQSFDQGIVVSQPRLVNNISATRCSKESNEIKLLRGKRLFANDEDTSRQESASLFWNTADEG